MKKFISSLLAISMIFSFQSATVYASDANEDATAIVNFDELRELNTENDRVTEKNISESVELEHGTMYIEENEEFRILYIVYNDGFVEYSICYRDNANVANTGSFNLIEETRNEDAEEIIDDNAQDTEAEINNKIDHSLNQPFNAGATYSDIDNQLTIDTNKIDTENLVDTLLGLDTEKAIDFSSRPTSRAVGSTTNAINACKGVSYYKSPVNSKFLGSLSSRGVTSSTYESVDSSARQVSSLRYYAGDTVTSIGSLLFGLNGTKIMRVVSNIYKAGKGYVAEKNGTASYYLVDNTRTKVARINGGTYYWAGHDVEFGVLFGDKSQYVDVTYDYAHPDYYNSVTYFNQKAISNYFY